MHYPTDRITHTTAFVTPIMEHWLEWEIAQRVHPMKDRSDDPPHHERTLYLWATSRSLHSYRVSEIRNQQHHEMLDKIYHMQSSGTDFAWCVWCVGRYWVQILVLVPTQSEVLRKKENVLFNDALNTFYL